MDIEQRLMLAEQQVRDALEADLNRALKRRKAYWLSMPFGLATLAYAWVLALQLPYTPIFMWASTAGLGALLVWQSRMLNRKVAEARDNLVAAAPDPHRLPPK